MTNSLKLNQLTFEESTSGLNELIPTFTILKNNSDEITINDKDMIAENTMSKLSSNNYVFTKMKYDNTTLTTYSYNAYSAGKTGGVINTNTIKTLKYDEVKYYNDNTKFKAFVSYATRTNFIEALLPFDIIKKYSIINVHKKGDYVIGISEYSVIVFDKNNKIISIDYLDKINGSKPSSFFSKDKYDKLINITSNIDAIKINDNYRLDLILQVDYTSNIVSLACSFDNGVITYLSNTKWDNSYKEAFVQNMVKGYIYYNEKINAETQLTEKTIQVSGNDYLFNTISNPKSIYLYNDLCFILGTYKTKSVIIYTNNLKTNADYAVIYLDKTPSLFIPLVKDDELEIIYQYADTDATTKYRTYRVNNKYELIINNGTYTKSDNVIIVNNNKYTITDDTTKNEITINKSESETNTITINYSSKEIINTTTLNSIFGTISLKIDNNTKAILSYINKTIEGTYEYTNNKHIIKETTSETETKITHTIVIDTSNNYITIDTLKLKYISMINTTNTLYKSTDYLIDIETDDNKKINVSCTRRKAEDIFDSNVNVQSKILSLTKGNVRYKVNKDETNNKYIFKYLLESTTTTTS